MKHWTFGKHFIISLTILLIFFLSKYISNMLAVIGIIGTDMFQPNEAAGVTIISGSDGPTAIYGMGYKGEIYTFGQYLVAFVVLLIMYFPFNKYLERIFNRSQ